MNLKYISWESFNFSFFQGNSIGQEDFVCAVEGGRHEPAPPVVPRHGVGQGRHSGGENPGSR